MPPAPDINTASLILAGIVLLVAALLGWGEWRGRRARDPDPSPGDARHFARQDARRWLGIAVLALLAAGVAVGSRVPPRLGVRANPQFVGIWLAVFVLIFVLLSLGMMDWVALRRYAGRQRDLMLRERVEILRDEARLKKAASPPDGGRNGHGGPAEDLLG